MLEMMARQVSLQVNYNGHDISGPVADSLLSFTYSDNPSGQLDDLQITLEDSEQLWQGPWNPDEGDTITARIKTINWNGPNQFGYVQCGKFEVDSFDYSGMPDVVQIKALSLPVSSPARNQRNSRAWEKVSLKTIAADIAKRAGLKLIYEAPDNPPYDRVEQTEQTDMAFLMDLATREGIAIKVADGSLVLFDEAVYEAKPTVCDIVRGTDDVLSYTFNWSVTNAAFRACELTYTDLNSDTTLKVTYTPPGAPRSGPVLKVSDSASSQAEALRKAKNRLRERNKNYGKGSLSLKGDVRIATGVTIMVKGWGKFDGKYIVESAKHSVTKNGYITDPQIRKVLGW